MILVTDPLRPSGLSGADAHRFEGALGRMYLHNWFDAHGYWVAASADRAAAMEPVSLAAVTAAGVDLIAQAQARLANEPSADISVPWESLLVASPRVTRPQVFESALHEAAVVLVSPWRASMVRSALRAPDRA